MRFYYASLFSTLLWIVYCVIVIPLFWLVWAKLLGRKLTLRSAIVSALVVAILPWTEELWIAFRFSQLCRKDAGVFINKTVEVDGFYDSTLRSAWENTRPGRYKFVEEPTADGSGTERVELASAAERQRALAWYAELNPGKDRPKERSIFFPLNERQVIAVLPNGVDARKVTKLDKPTARYQYKTLNSHTPVLHQIKRFEDVVIDMEAGEVLGRFVNYYRGRYWFFISLDAPTIPCAEAEAGVRQHGTFSVYALTLKPSR